MPFAVIVPMTAVGVLLDEPAVIFPEGAALAFGFWVLVHPGWSASRWRLVTLPPGCALIGMLLTVVPGPRWIIEVAALTCALLLLQYCRSRLAPSLSAAMFPLVFNVHSWLYPASVLAICLTVAGGDWLMRRRTPPAAVPVPPRWDWRVTGTFWFVALLWLAVGGLTHALPAVAFAPPLFVSGLEWVITESRDLRLACRRCGVLVGAALLGSTAVWILPVGWIAGSVATGLTMLLLRASGETHAPALAIALIPLVIAPPDPVLYTASIGTGAVVLHLLGHMATPRTDRARSLLRQRIRQLRQ